MILKKWEELMQFLRTCGFTTVVKSIFSVVGIILRVAIGAAATVLLIAIICAFTFMGTLGDYLQDDILPEAYVDIASYDMDENSYLYYVDADGEIQEYQQIFAETTSRWATIDEIPDILEHAAVAIEDHRFYEHQGVDWITTTKATARMFFGNSSAGGSSITQQLTKNILLTDDETADDVTVQRKVLEIFRAIEIEKQYTKEEIMEMYLNVIYLGQGCRGVRSAAATYFGKELEKLSIAECASLISITNNPSMFDPYSDIVFEYNGEMTDGRQRNRMRQELVLGEMLRYGYISQEEYDAAMEEVLVFKNGIAEEDELVLCPNNACKTNGEPEDRVTVKDLSTNGNQRCCPACGTEIVVKMSASQDHYTWFTDAVLRDVAQAFAKQDGVTWNDASSEMYMRQIQTGGYHIYTTLDMDVQNQVDEVYGNLENIPDTRGGQQLQSAIVVIDNRTGDIVALAGGVGEKTGYLDYCRATMATLQSGSSIKPVTVYAPAFEMGAITPATVVDDLPVTYTHGAYPLNDTRSYSYSRSIYSAVESSVNAACAHTLMKIGMDKSFEFATTKFGLTTLVDKYVDAYGQEHTDIAMGPLALGAQTWGVHVDEMAAAFATFANDGVYRQARTFTKVYDSEGNLVLDNTQYSEQILSQKTVDYMNYCLVAGTASGTGTNANLASTYDSYSDVYVTTAGKTGTSGDNKDKWYCGFTDYYTAAIWCGFDEPETIYPANYSGNPAALLFKKVMAPLHVGFEDRPLYNRSAMKGVSVCLDSGMYATDACKNDIRGSRVTSALVYPEDISGKSCNKHVVVEQCSAGGSATEYCKKFAEVDPSIKFEKKSLVKLTQAEMNEISRARSYGLGALYSRDDYVYCLKSDGKDGVYKGFSGKTNTDSDAPYLVCSTHTKAAWEKYEKEQEALKNEEEKQEADKKDPVKQEENKQQNN